MEETNKKKNSVIVFDFSSVGERKNKLRNFNFTEVVRYGSLAVTKYHLVLHVLCTIQHVHDAATMGRRNVAPRDYGR